LATVRTLKRELELKFKGNGVYETTQIMMFEAYIAKD
jgi:hypothetical protein